MRGAGLLLAVHDFPPAVGGEATLYHALARHLPPRETLVLAPRAPGAETIDAALPAEVVRRWLPAHGGTLSRIARGVLSGAHLLALLARRPPRYILCGQLLSLGVPTRLVAAGFGIPYAVFVHGADLVDYHDRIPWASLIRWVLRGSDAVIVNSRFTGSLVERLAPGEAQRIVVLPIGVDPAPAVDPAEAARLRQRYGLADGPVLLSVSRLVAMKGHDMVLEALPGLVLRFPSLRYLVVGDGPYRVDLERRAGDLGVAPSVIFAGRVPATELPAHYALASLFVQLSRETGQYDGLEGFGISLLEAASHGVPSIAGRSGGIPEAVAEGESGLLVPPRDPLAFAAAAARLLADSPERGRMAQAARRWAAAHPWERAAGCLRSLLPEA